MDSNITPDLHMPTRIYLEVDIIDKISITLNSSDNRIAIITTKRDFSLLNKQIEKLAQNIRSHNKGCIIYDELQEFPDTEDIDRAVSFLKKSDCNVVIGFGEIESINSAKAISTLLTNYLFCYDLLTGNKILNKPAKLIVIPTVPLFGFEISPILYLNEIHNLSKRVYYNYDLYPYATFIDPNISKYAEEDVIIYNTLCSMGIATESIISKNSNEIIKTYSLKSIDLIFRHLPIFYRDSSNDQTRTQLFLASLMAGISFSISYLSASLAISLAIASRTKIKISNAMAVIIPHIMEFYLTSSPSKYVHLSKVMGEDVKDITVIEAAIKAVEGIRRLQTDLNLELRLSNYNISKSDFKEISKLAMSYPFLENSPRQIDENEIETILISAY